jgi:hypothetical protein
MDKTQNKALQRRLHGSCSIFITGHPACLVQHEEEIDEKREKYEQGQGPEG